MKNIHFSLFFLFFSLVFSNVFAKNTYQKSLYDQLCEINREWHKYSDIAEKRGYTKMSPIMIEQDALVFHIQALENIFLERDVLHLSIFQQQNRKDILNILHKYWQRRDCPRNHNLAFRNPVFIDEENRYCAVGYLMSNTGKDKLCKLVQKTNNYIYISQIKNAEFEEWQKNSGLTLEELAWIQPGYNPEITITEWNEKLINRKPEILVGENALSFMDSVSNMKDWEVFGNIFMRGFMGYPFAERWKEISSKNAMARNIKPDFKAIQGKGSVSAWGFHKREFYIVLDSVRINEGDTTYKEIREANLLKWDANKKTWQTELTLPNDKQIFSFFEHQGKFYASGGGNFVTQKGEKYTTTYNSYLLVKKGKNWEKLPQEYNGYVYGIYTKNKKTYIKSVIHKDFEIPAEETKPVGN